MKAHTRGRPFHVHHDNSNALQASSRAPLSEPALALACIRLAGVHTASAAAAEAAYHIQAAASSVVHRDLLLARVDLQTEDSLHYSYRFLLNVNSPTLSSFSRGNNPILDPLLKIFKP
jgi:hypothetical protein